MEVAAPIFIAGAKLGPMKTGVAGQRERIVSGLALRCLCGRSSPLFIRLYSEGLLNATFGSSVDFAAGQGFVSFEGETKEPQKVLDEVKAEMVRIAKEGIDPDLFERQKKASLGSRIRALTNFSGLAVSIVEGAFAGFQALDSFQILDQITCEEASEWVRNYLVPERMALSVVYPKEG